MSEVERRRTAASVAITAIALGVVLMASAPARAAAPSVTGSVENGTKDRPVAGVTVILHRFGQQGELETSSTTTDVDGRFSFTDPLDAATSFQVTVRYGGGVYRSSVVPAEGADAPVAVTVYEPSPDAGRITLANWVVWIDREGAGVAVQHDLQWDNAARTAFVGDPSEGGGAPPVVELPLAPGAQNLQFLGMFLRSPGAVRGSTFVESEPIAPGTSTATLRYTTPEPLDRLTFPVGFATTNFQLFVPEGMDVTSDVLSLAGTTSDQGVTYQVFSASALAPGDRVDVTLSGVAAGRGLSPTLFVLIGAALVVLLGALAVWRLGRGRGERRRRGSRGSARPRPRIERTSAARSNGHRGSGRGDHRATGRADTTRRRVLDEDEDVDLLIDEIAALDLSYERGVLDGSTYQSLRAAAKRRLLRAGGADARRGASR